MALVGTIAANLTAGTAQFEAGMNKVGGLIKTLQGQLSKRFVLNLDIAGALSKLKEIVTAGFENGVALAAQSEQLGIAADKLAGMQLAADYAEVSQESLSAALEKVSKNIGNAAFGGGELNKTLTRLGLSSEDLASIPLDEAMAKIADAIASVENKYEQAALAADVFGKGGIKLMNLLRGGSAELRKATEEAKQFGTAISQEDVEKFKAFDDQMDRIAASAKGAGIALASAFAPAVEAAADSINLFLNQPDLGLGIMPSLKLPNPKLDMSGRVKKFDPVANNPATQLKPPVDPDFINAMKEAEKILDNLLSPAEKFNKQIDYLFSLVGEGVLTWEEYDRAVQAAFDETGPGKMIRDLEEQVRLWGMTDDEIERYRAAAEGASAADLLRIRLLQEQRELLREQQDEYDEIARRQEEMGDRGMDLARSLRTPLEVFADRMEELRELFDGGFIDQETFDRAITQAAEQLERSLPQLRLGAPTGFAEVGSQDAFRTLNQNQNNNPATRRLEDIVREAREQNRRLADIAENTAREAIGLGII